MMPAIPRLIMSDILLGQSNTSFSILLPNLFPYKCMAVHDIVNHPAHKARDLTQLPVKLHLQFFRLRACGSEEILIKMLVRI